LSPRSSPFTHAVTPLAFDRAKLHRERLVLQIHNTLPRRLIALVAPPGYGKSTLLADFATHTELPVAWMRLTSADQDVMRLANVMRASLQKRFHRLRGQPDLDALAGSSPEGLARAFVDTIEQHIPEAFILAIDDMHLINPSPPGLTFLDTLIREQPDRMTVLASGQELPDISLATLVVDGQMVGIGAHELALTRQELGLLARLRLGDDLDEVELARLHEETQGWISGILLSNTMLGTASQTLAQRGRPMVYEYLAAVVLGQQPDEVSHFMLDSSVLPVMTVASCDAVLKRDDSQRLLTRLVREGLFVMATEQTPRTYEYHPVMRAFLLESLNNKDPARLRTLRKLAANHLDRTGAHEEAVQLYFEAGAGKQAAALIARSAGEMHQRGRVQTLETWVRRLDEAGASTPVPFLSLASTYTDQGRLEQAEASLRRAFQVLDATRASKATRAHAWNARARIALHRGRFQEVFDSVEEAERLLGGEGTTLWHAAGMRLRARAILGSGGDPEQAEQLAAQAVRAFEQLKGDYSIAQALLDLSLIQVTRGKPHEASATSERAHTILVRIGSPLPLAISSNNLAVFAYRAGDYEASLQHFMSGLRHARQAAAPAFEARIFFGQADVFSDLGLPYQAAELYNQGLRLATQIENPELLSYGYLQTSALHRRCGTSRLPLVWLERARDAAVSNEQPSGVAIQLAALTMQASVESSRARLLELLDQRSPALDADQRTMAFYFLGKLELVAGDTERTLEAFSRALEWAGSHGTEQLIAGELTYDRQAREFLAQTMTDGPVRQVLLQKVELMRAVARKHQQSTEATSEEVQLRLRAFGGAEVEHRGKRIAELEPQPRQILFYLADNVPAERDRLMEALWPEAPASRQTASLYTGLHSLRQALGKDIIHIEGLLYQINPGYVLHYDVAEFEQVAAMAEGLPTGDPRRLFALTEAIHACNGAFLPEFGSEWVDDRRQALEARFLRLLTAHAEEALARGQLGDAVDSIRQALDIEPLRDDLNLRYLELLKLLDRRSEAIGHYQRYVRLLADELGLDPPDPLRELYTRLIG